MLCNGAVFQKDLGLAGTLHRHTGVYRRVKSRRCCFWHSHINVVTTSNGEERRRPDSDAAAGRLPQVITAVVSSRRPRHIRKERWAFRKADWTRLDQHIK